MGKTTKKLVLLATCTAMVFTMLTGCGSKSSTTADSTAKKDVTLTLLIDNQSKLDGINAVIDAFNKKTGIKVQVDLRPGGSEGDNIVKTRLATGDMDDLCFYNSGSLFKALNPASNFVDLSKESYVSTLDDAFKTTVTVDGKLYGIPNGSSTAGGILYNKKVYAELGLSVPKTWNEFLANCEKIKAAGKTAVIGSYKSDWTSQVILLSDYYNVQAAAPTFASDFTANKAKYATTPAALRGFEKQQEIFKKGYMNSDYLATTYDTALKMLAEGTGVQYPMITFALPAISADKISDIGFFPTPGDSADKNGLTVWEPGGAYVYNKSKNIAEAKQFLAYFVSADGIAAYASKMKANGPYAVKGAKLPDDAYTAVKDMLPYFNAGKIAPALEFLSPLKGPNLPQISVQNGSGINTPAENAAQYDKDVEKQAKQLGIAGW
jgi:raffinose/stachyose/melibiose transport system substrate-binding protein